MSAVMVLLLAAQFALLPPWDKGKTQYVPTNDPRVQQIRYFRVGANGVGNLVGDVVPKGQVWLIRAAGIFTNEVTPREWMMQILVNEPFGPGLAQPFGWAGEFTWMLVPMHRLTGSALGTPTLAIDREVILMPGEALCGRVNSQLSAGGQMGLLYVGWAFDESMLPYLLKIPPR